MVKYFEMQQDPCYSIRAASSRHSTFMQLNYCLNIWKCVDIGEKQNFAIKVLKSLQGLLQHFISKYGSIITKNFGVFFSLHT